MQWSLVQVLLGQMILKELTMSERANARPLCIIDDNPNKWGRNIGGVPIVGGRDCIMESVKKYNIDQILFAIPTASPENKGISLIFVRKQAVR